MGKLAVPLIVLVLAIGVLFAMDRPTPPADFRFINRGDVKTIDPQRLSWMQDIRISNMLFEGLVVNDVFTQGYDIAPGVAERWEVETFEEQVGGETLLRERYRFHLRPDATWSNGEPVTSQDFVFAWRRAVLPDTAADYAGFFLLIRGVQEFSAWRVQQTGAFAERVRGLDEAGVAEAARALWAETERRFTEMVAVRAVDSRTLEVELNEPTPYFLDLCAFATFCPVFPPLVRQYDVLDLKSGRISARAGWTKPDMLVNNGPFRLIRWRYKRDMYFEKNPRYWNAGAIAVDSVLVPSVDEPNAQALAFGAGEVDWVSDCTVPYRVEMLEQKRQFYREHQAEYDRLAALGLDQFEIDRHLPPDPRKNVHAVPAFGTYWYNFNCLPRLPDGRENPFHDARVRRAFAMMVDKRAICDTVQRIGNPVRRTMIPPDSIAGYTSPRGLDCISDAQTPEVREAMIAQARALLAEAGYPDLSRFPTVEILFNKDGGHDLTAQSVARDWEQNLGVKVRLAQKDVAVFADDLKKANYMVSRAGWYGDYGDPTTFLDLSRTGDGNNDRKYSNPVYDDLLAKAKRERDPAKRMSILSEAERIIMEEDLPLVPLYGYVNVYLMDVDRVSGVNPHPRSDQKMYLIDVLGDGKGEDRPRVMRRRIEDPPFAAAR